MCRSPSLRCMPAPVQNPTGLGIAIMGIMSRQAGRIVALVVIAVLYGAAQLPRPELGVLKELVDHYRFEKHPLDEPPLVSPRRLRQVHPSLEHVVAWISAFGASVAVNDLDGDGLPNDLCHVEVRSDQVIVSPAPGTPRRYSSFTLTPGPLPYQPATMAPSGCLAGDFNEDGFVDLLVSYWGRTPVLFLRRAGAPEQPLDSAAYERQELLAGSARWYTTTMTAADLDGDGHVDLVLGNYFPDGARLLDAKDGGEEQMPNSLSHARNGGTSRIFLWKSASAGPTPAVSFTEASDALDTDDARAWTLAVGAADLDGDQLPELYFANDFGPDVLLHNRSTPGHLKLVHIEGRWSPGMPKSKVVGRDSFKSMGIDFADLNDDGWPDLFVSNITESFAFEESNFVFLSTGHPEQLREGIAPYADHSEELGLSRGGWGWDTRFGDFDNDGHPEALLAAGFVQGTVNRWPELQELSLVNETLVHRSTTWLDVRDGDDISGKDHLHFFARRPGERFWDLSHELGIGQAQMTRAIATADFDGDGRLDFVIANQWSDSFGYLNRSPTGDFLGLNLRMAVAAKGEEAPRIKELKGLPPGVSGSAAIGASAVVHLPNGHRMIAQVDGGNGHSGDRSPDLHFGLGKLAPGQKVTVDLTWRDRNGTVQKERLALEPGWHTVLLGCTPLSSSAEREVFP